MRSFFAVVLTSVAAGVQAAPPDGGADRLFATRVLPALKDKCFACHGGDPAKIKGGFDLTSRDALLKGGDSGPAVVPGKPSDSPVVAAVARTDPDTAMPPKENDKLTPEQVEAVRMWVEGGAPWPSAEKLDALAKADQWNATGGVTVRTSGGLSADWTDRRYKPDDLWAYRAVAKPSAQPGSHPIDGFLDTRLRSARLSPAPPADKVALIRRVTFDLIGLPPTPGEVRAFVSNTAPDAYEKLIDRLLASPHYGERWGRHWLDVARYADSSGFANDYERGNAWRYRDYVVRSFNADKPYDQFVREQLAGDEIDPSNPEFLVAAGFLRMGAWELTGMEVAKIARQRFLDDVTDTVGQAFLAHPLQCCRCHDHKFDPLPTRDYYSIQAVFATTQLAERPAAFLPTENQNGFDEKKYLVARQARHQATLKELEAKEEAAGRAWAAERKVPYVARKAGLRQGMSEDKLPPANVGQTARDLGMERIARKGLERIGWELDRYKPVALSVYSGRTPEMKAVLQPLRVPADRLTAGELEATAILAGGDPFSPTTAVAPGLISAVAGVSKWEPDPPPPGVEGRRLAFANWVASADNPLTARVMVNRIWQGHFGRGLVSTPNNFGATGKKPTHPALLDYLAAEFVDSGWSVKKLHKLILTSAAYRRASRHPDPKVVAEKDPTGELLALFPPRRLSAEELRDAILSVSGELNPALGGIPVRPEINPEVALQPRQVMGTFAPAWEPSPKPEQRHRRSLYATQLRGLRDPFFEVFNQPGPEAPCEGRDASTVTPQVFALLNSAATADRALAFATRLLKETKTRDAAIDRAFRLAFGRPPTAAEAAKCLSHWDAMTTRHLGVTLTKPVYPREVTREAVEEMTGERFTITEVLDSRADFVPDPHPADAPPETRGLMEVCLVLLNANEFVSLD